VLGPLEPGVEVRGYVDERHAGGRTHGFELAAGPLDGRCERLHPVAVELRVGAVGVLDREAACTARIIRHA